MSGSAAGRVLLDGADAGSGFAIADSRALTAGHVVWNEKTAGGWHLPAGRPRGSTAVYVIDRSEPGEVRAEVRYQPEGAEPILVNRIEVNTSLDVAVLHLQRPAPAALPIGEATAGAEWRVETQPDSKAPVLRGTVTEPRRQLTNDAGNQTTMIQLWVQEDIGDYKGYSGSPVIAPQASGMPDRVLGVLVEQAFWRTGAQLGVRPKVANVLYAAPIDLVKSEFDLADVPVARSVMDIPLPVSFELRRPQLDRVIDALLDPPSGGRLVGLVGMGGSGKSVLAAAAARDAKVSKAFPDGRFWLELGPDPPLLQLQASLAAALGDSRPITTVPQGRARLSRLLGERRCLLVLDNVWDKSPLPNVALVGTHGRVLVTSRDVAALPGATRIRVGEFDPEAAKRLLADWTATMPGQLPDAAEQVAHECGYLPLALAVCGALINAGSHTWPQLLTLLRHAELDALPIALEDYPHPSLAVALGASIDTLSPYDRDRYLRLAVFIGQGAVSLTALQMLWGLDQHHTTAVIGDLAGKSLLRAEAGRVSLHDLQMDYVTRRTPDLPALHEQLLAAYAEHCPGGWATGPDDGYFYQHLAHHLHQAGRIPELRALLLDPDWMTAKLSVGTISGLLADYGNLPFDPAVRLVAGALRLAAHILADDPSQLPSQLIGRLAGHPDPRLRDLLRRIRRRAATQWLRPQTASLVPAGGPLLRTLTGHDSWVEAVAVSADGGRAVSGSDDSTVRVWDVEAGALEHTLAGHGGAVKAVAVSADGRRAISTGRHGDEAVRVWDLEAGALVRTLAAHDYLDHFAGAVAVSADGRRAISAGGTLRVWDVEAGALVHTLTGHTGWVTAVAVSADGRRAVSGGGHGDEAVRVWDLEAGALVHTLTGHDYSVFAVAVSADGRRAVSGGQDDTVRVWDVEAGALVHTLTGHNGWVTAMAVSADGRRAVSGGQDDTVRVWDLDDSGTRQSCNPAGHGGAVKAVAVSADGRRAVSGGEDETVRVWDLEAGALVHTLAGHGGAVKAVAVSADGRRAVSGGEDETVRVWDLEAGALVHALTGHDAWVTAVAVSADGRRAVSGGGDSHKAVRVWDLDTGRQIATVGRRLWLFLRRSRFTSRSVKFLSLTADGRRAVSGGDDKTVRVWDLDTGALVRSLTANRWDYVGAVAVSADGCHAVSADASTRTMRVWDLDTGALVRSHDSRVTAVAVSADGARAVSVGTNATVRLWDIAHGEALASFVSDSPITVLAATPSCTRVIAGTSTGAVHLLELCGNE